MGHGLVHFSTGIIRVRWVVFGIKWSCQLRYRDRLQVSEKEFRVGPGVRSREQSFPERAFYRNKSETKSRVHLRRRCLASEYDSLGRLE